jgi:hypothetical protein
MPAKAGIHALPTWDLTPRPSHVMPAKAGIHDFPEQTRSSPRRPMPIERKKALLFCEQKRSKKNFDSPRASATPAPTPAVTKSFLLLFFKKEALSSCFFSHRLSPATQLAVAAAVQRTLK